LVLKEKFVKSNPSLFIYFKIAKSVTLAALLLFQQLLPPPLETGRNKSTVRLQRFSFVKERGVCIILRPDSTQWGAASSSTSHHLVKRLTGKRLDWIACEVPLKIKARVNFVFQVQRHMYPCPNLGLFNLLISRLSNLARRSL
jgi:hypothetical protein